MFTIQTNDADGTVIRCPKGATPRKGWTIRQVDNSALTSRPADKPTAMEKWVDDAVTWVVPTPTPRDLAAAAFNALPVGKQAMWESTRAAVDRALQKNDFALAVEILQTTPETYDGAETDRNTFLALFVLPTPAAVTPVN